ncbi:hypothetical protein Tco_0787893, partial [Tanacetum coccineum]
FKKPERHSTPDSDWNVRKSIDSRPPQTWISKIAQAEKPPLSFDELMSTPIDFSTYVMNHLKIDKLTQEHLVGPTFNLLKGTCKSHVELEYNFKECYKALTDRLDWNNPKGKEYPFDLSKPLTVDFGIGIRSHDPARTGGIYLVLETWRMRQKHSLVFLAAIQADDEDAYDDGCCSKKQTWSMACSMQTAKLRITETALTANSLASHISSNGRFQFRLMITRVHIQRIPQSPTHRYPVHLEVPPSPDYVPGPKELEQAPLSPEFVPEPVYSEFMPPEDEVFPAEEQPLPATILPTADSPGYFADFDPEEDLEEDLIDYPADGGDDDDDKSSDDDEDDDSDVEQDEDEEEEEHPAPTDSVPPPIHCVTARMSIRDEPPISFWSEAEIARLLAIPSPPPSPLSSWSSPLPQIPSPPLPVSSLVPVSPPPLLASPTYPLGYRAAMIRLRAETSSTSHSLPMSTLPLGTPPLIPIPLPTPSPPLLLPSTDCRSSISEVTLPPRKRLCIALGLRYEVGESSSAPTARPTGDTWDEMLMGMPGAPATDDTKLGRRMTNFVTTVRQDIDEIYGRLDDAQDDRSLMSSRLNMLFRDRRAHARTVLLMEREARLSCEAWGRSMDASDTARSEVRALRTTVLA